MANDLVKQPLTFFGAIGVLVYLTVQNPDLAYVLCSLAVIPICVLPGEAFWQKNSQSVLEMQKRSGDLAARVTENLAATREVRAFNLQKIEKAKFKELVKLFFKFRIKVVKYHNLISPSIELIFSERVLLSPSIMHQKKV